MKGCRTMDQEPTPNLKELWRRHSQLGDRQAREELILHYASLVKYVVGWLAVSLPASLEEGDLVGYGTIGLIKAVDRYDPTRGVKFETYATARIRGQVIDSLRALDLLPRSARRQAREIEHAVSNLSQTLGRIPENAEVADYLGISLDQYHDRLMYANCGVVSLDQPVTSETGERYTLGDTLEDATMPVPSEQADARDLKAQLTSAIGALPERERLMISLYYNDGLTMKEIGQVLGVSESRVSQMHAKAVLSLRGLMKASPEPSPIIYKRGGIRASVYATAR
jgi:RNA polymerase sigma factor for flagellar operon FliA